MNYKVTTELRHLASGDYDTLCQVLCQCGNSYNLQYAKKLTGKYREEPVPDCTNAYDGSQVYKMIEIEKHTYGCDKCNMEWKSNSIPESDDLNCGSILEHLERNTCPKKQGVVGDCHYELYVQQEITVSADSEEEAEKLAEEKATIDYELDEYLNSHNVTEFDSQDFEGEVISIDETDEPEQVKRMIIVHEKLYYDNE